MRKQRLDAEIEYEVKDPDKDTDDDNAGDNDKRIVHCLLAGGPDDLAALAFSSRNHLPIRAKRQGFLTLVSSAMKLLPSSYFVSRCSVCFRQKRQYLFISDDRIVLLVLVRVIVPLLALRAGERNLNAHK